MLNRRDRETLDEAIGQSLTPLTLDDVLRMQRDGAQVLDVREPAEYAGGHLRGSLNVGLSGSFATWAGVVLDARKPIVLIGDLGREQEAAIRLGRVGLDDVVGYLCDGAGALAARPDLVERTERINALTLAPRLEWPAAPLLLDVRGPGEFAQGHLPGAVNVPLTDLPRRLGELPSGRDITVYCAGGYRSSVAASLLLRAGHERLTELVGGISAWQASRLQTAVA